MYVYIYIYIYIYIYTYMYTYLYIYIYTQNYDYHDEQIMNIEVTCCWLLFYRCRIRASGAQVS